MTEETNKELSENEKIKYKVPELSFEEFLQIEAENKKIKGPYKIKAEDKEKALEYFKRR